MNREETRRKEKKRLDEETGQDREKAEEVQQTAQGWDRFGRAELRLWAWKAESREAYGALPAGRGKTDSKLTWLVLGGDPAVRSHRVEQLTAL